ncbi:hypothetical protein OVA24_10620 [Luteolibacter sp. SL250]|uniref:hypothetical protein n=1 Tax=Luteolibacter sp. SL250 TaxID=2995170 RepID=UPI0022713E47|nr:hypothetical protein [Luteolibacter sp. SL250]WAC21836.1 hypothetical protein OVA24_10620 [Luteolibacter sp. SL250]
MADYDDDDPAAGYRGIEYEREVMSGKRPRDPNYLRQPEYVPIRSDYQPDFSWASAPMPKLMSPSGRSSLGGGSGLSAPSTFSSSGRQDLFSKRRNYTLDSDYRTTDLLGGGSRATDRWGNSVTTSQGLDGRPRYTTSSGVTYTNHQTLGGGRVLRGSDGSSYRREQLLNGSYQYKGDDGSVYRREQTLGGGYRYTKH